MIHDSTSLHMRLLPLSRMYSIIFFQVLFIVSLTQISYLATCNTHGEHFNIFGKQAIPLTCQCTVSAGSLWSLAKEHWVTRVMPSCPAVSPCSMPSGDAPEPCSTPTDTRNSPELSRTLQWAMRDRIAWWSSETYFKREKSHRCIIRPTHQ